MIPVAEAEALIRQWVPDPSESWVELPELAGRVLARDLRADRDGPPYDRVAMDGIALDSREAGLGRLRIAGLQPAGREPLRRTGPGTAIEVATGAVLPLGCDAVVPYERLRRVCDPGDRVELGEPVRPGQNVHRQGADYRAGDLLIPAGTVLRSPHAHLLATCGAPGAWVRRRCAWALAATGDELVAIEAAPLAHQIRRSNSAAICAEALAWGQAPLEQRALPDDAGALAAGIAAMAEGRDALVLTGGVSRGALDLLPKALESLGARMQFHGVAQKPGKPFWFGILPGGARVFSLPGNPVASLVAFRRFVLPALLRFEGRNLEPRRLSPLDVHPGSGTLTYFLPVMRTPEGHRPIPPGGSGDLRPLALSEGFVEVDPGWDGSAPLPYFPWGAVD